MTTVCITEYQVVCYKVCLLSCFVCYRLLSYAAASEAPLPTSETLLNNEILWLKKVRVRQLIPLDLCLLVSSEVCI